MAFGHLRRQRVTLTPKLDRQVPKPIRFIICTQSPVHRRYIRLTQNGPRLTQRQELATAFKTPSKAQEKKNETERVIHTKFLIISSSVYGFEI
jgi:hypothetical protein